MTICTIQNYLKQIRSATKGCWSLCLPWTEELRLAALLGSYPPFDQGS